jgi:hypothetical protein
MLTEPELVKGHRPCEANISISPYLIMGEDARGWKGESSRIPIIFQKEGLE